MSTWAPRSATVTGDRSAFSVASASENVVAHRPAESGRRPDRLDGDRRVRRSRVGGVRSGRPGSRAAASSAASATAFASRARSSVSVSTSMGAGCPVHSSNAAALWLMSITSPFWTAAAPAAAASRSSRLWRGVYSRSSTISSGGSSSAGMGVSSGTRPTELALTSSLVRASSASSTDSCHGLARSSMCAALLPKCRTRPSARWRWRLNTMTCWKPEVMSACTTARAAPPAPRTTAALGIFCLPTSVSSALRKPGTSVLWPMSRVPSRVTVSTAPVAWASSDEPVHHRHGSLLEGDRDVGAQRLRVAQGGDGLGQVDEQPVHQLVAGVDALRIERGLLEHARQRVGHRMPDEGDTFGHAGTPAERSTGRGQDLVGPSRAPARDRALSPASASGDR